MKLQAGRGRSGVVSSCQYVTRYALFGAKTQRRQWECMPVSSRVVSSPVLSQGGVSHAACLLLRLPRRPGRRPLASIRRQSMASSSTVTGTGNGRPDQDQDRTPIPPWSLLLSARLDSIALHASPPSLAFCFPRRPVGRSPGPARGPSLPGPKAHRRATVWQCLPAPFGRSASSAAGGAGTHAAADRGTRSPAPGPVRCAAAQASMRQTTTRQGKQRPARRRHVIGLRLSVRPARWIDMRALRSPQHAAQLYSLALPAFAVPCGPRRLVLRGAAVSCASGEKNPLWNDHRQQVSLNLNSNKQSTGAYDMYYYIYYRVLSRN